MNTLKTEKEKLNYRTIFRIMKDSRKFILQTTCVSAVLLFLILLLVYPITYSSAVKVLPPEEGRMGALGGLFAAADLTGMMNLPGSGSNSQLYAEILKSRTAAEYVVGKCGLKEYFKTDDPELAASKLQNIINVEVSKEGIISLSADMSTGLFARFSPERKYVRWLSARVANTYAEALDHINRLKLNSKARRSREYVGRQLDETKVKLDSVENTLRQYQEKNKTISLPEQLTASIETASKIKSEIIFTEIQIGTLSKNLNNQNDLSLEGLKTKLEQLKKQYAMIQGGDKLNDDYLPDFSNVPKTSLELARLMRDVKIQNEVYLLLQKNYYAESIQENKDVPTVEILDTAIEPLREQSPRLVFHTVTGAMFVFCLVSLFVVYRSDKSRYTNNI